MLFAKRIVLVLVVVWVGFGAVCALAGGGREGKSIILRGLVVDSNSQPVAGAEVAVFEKYYDYYHVQDYAKMLTSVQRTDSEGKFLLNVITTSKNNQYHTFVVARKEGFALGWDALSYNHSYKPEYNLYIILEKPNTLAGKVVDAEGAPVTAAMVQAVPKTSYLERLYQRPIYAPEKWFTVKTSSDGAFVFKNLSADTSADFWVQVRGRDLIYHYTPHVLNGIGFEVGIKDLKLVLPHGTTIQGKVVEKKGSKRVSGVRLLLQVQDPGNEQQQRYRDHELVSGPDGAFSIRGVPEGKHILRMVTPTDRTAEWIAQPVSINVSGERDLKKVRLKVEKGAMLEVIAREKTTGRPLSGIQIFVRKMFTDFPKGFFRIADTGTDGIAHIRVPPGQWNVSVWYSDDYTGPLWGVQATAIKGRRSRVEIMLEPRFGRIRGRVSEGTGRPARPAVVKPYPFGGTVFTDSSGGFEAKRDTQYPVAIVGARDVGRNLAGFTDVRNRSGAVRVQLKPAVSITGVITDANGAGVPAARVRLSIHTIHGVRAMSAVDEVIADSKGRYKIDAVVPEREGFSYRLSVNAAGYGPVRTRRISVKKGAGEVVEIPAKLVAADASVSGMVVDKSGRPAANIAISVHECSRFNQPTRATATDSQGRFQINRICKKPLIIYASAVYSSGEGGTLLAEGGDKNVKIVIGQEGFRKQDGVHAPLGSMVGRALPDLKELNVDINPEQIKDKMVLVCFWCIGKRPSEDCVRRLGKRAELLAEKGVQVILAHVRGTTNEEHVNSWLKKHKIDFTSGWRKGDDNIYRIRRAWGAKRLPWLILTDKDHIITADGFGIGDLNKKIEEACDVEL